MFDIIISSPIQYSGHGQHLNANIDMDGWIITMIINTPDKFSSWMRRVFLDHSEEVHIKLVLIFLASDTNSYQYQNDLHHMIEICAFFLFKRFFMKH